jgi:hypothetical protein
MGGNFRVEYAIESLKEALEHLIHGHFGLDPAQGQGIAFAADHRIDGGRGEKVRGAVFGFAPANLLLVFVCHAPMIGQFDQIDRYLACALAQALGNEASQQDIESGFELIQVLELGGQFPEDGLARGGPCESLASLVYGNLGGGNKDQDMEQIGDVNVLTSGC